VQQVMLLGAPPQPSVPTIHLRWKPCRTLVGHSSMNVVPVRIGFVLLLVASDGCLTHTIADKGPPGVRLPPPAAPPHLARRPTQIVDAPASSRPRRAEVVAFHRGLESGAPADLTPDPGWGERFAANRFGLKVRPSRRPRELSKSLAF
jgi:hypothetical protein